MSWISANRLSIVAEETTDVRIVSRDRTGKQRDGVETTDVEKRHYTDEIQASLSGEQLMYGLDFISNQPGENQAKLEEQLHLFRRMITPSSDDNVRTKPKVSYSGAGKDDTVMALGITLFHSRLTRDSPEYRKEAREQQWYDD